MDLTLNEDQEAFAESIDDALARKYTAEFRGKAAASDVGWDEKLFSTLAEIGASALTIDEEHDGLDAGAGEVYAALYALGQNAAIEPFLDGVYLPSWLLSASGSAPDEVLSALAAGEAIAAVAHSEPGRVWDAAPATTATGDGSKVTLSGTKTAVAHADQAKWLLVTASGDAGFGVYLVNGDAEGITRTDGRTADWTRVSRVTFEGTPATLLGSAGDQGRRAFDAAVARARIAVLAEAVGLMDRASKVTVDYLKSRKQFGVTLSTFQALVHRAADLYAEVELARSVALWATASLERDAQTDDTDVDATADDAFVYIAQAARVVAEEVVQLHGGIGMTFETPISHYAARLTSIEQSYGGVAAARRRVLKSGSPLTAPTVVRS
ncbi:acyl-CoA dehydrogenase family protein [Allobranchiibius huperziae]|uniref:Acyl-CoA dehydrogenase/oxidase C-terminal domain-containing protein n=1 Tax=Allobranchiibius huperziae TaxID=1874116 RepID=A0A853DGP0_9MICO|nr:acyl-CoA dehydrogenase [Allobranchiibius huperziae]NYJ74214.1 hypothetical protein [Allobranchiibius huperziae]